MRDDRVYLRHILEAGRVEGYVSGGRAEFLASTLQQDAVIRQLTVVGEAANKISDELKERRSDVPWARIISLRNTLVHEYWGVKLEVFWEILQHNVPELKVKIKVILEELDRAQ